MEMDTELTTRLKNVVTKSLGLSDVDSESLNENTHFSDNLGADSIDIVELIMATEREFKINIPDSLLENLTSYGELIVIVENAVRQKKAS